MTEEEDAVLTHLASAWDNFNKIEGISSAEQSRFLQAICEAQQLILIKIGVRVYDEKHPAPKE